MNGAIATRLLPPPDQRLVCLVPLLFGARLTVADVRPHAPTDEIDYYDEGWDFDNMALAAGAFLTWDGTGEPFGALRRTGDQRA